MNALLTRLAAAGLPVATLATVAATAAAQTPPPAATPAPAPPAATPDPAPGRLTLRTEGVLSDRGRPIALRGSRWRVRGTLSPWVPGQKAIVRFVQGGRKVKVKRQAIRRVRGKDAGYFITGYSARRSGRVTVRAVHRATSELGTVTSRAARVQVVRARASSGARGPVVRLLQAGLDRLGYAVSRSGAYDAATSRAVMAFRKVNGMSRGFAASKAVVGRVLAGRGGFRPRNRGAGRHAEADLSRQVLALVEGGRVVRTYHISSGKASTPTVLGSFRVYLKTPGTNAKGMVHSSYFIRGYAIHGYASVPPFPASHGCLRVPIPNALSIFRWLRHGDGVVVYR